MNAKIQESIKAKPAVCVGFLKAYFPVHKGPVSGHYITMSCKNTQLKQF